MLHSPGGLLHFLLRLIDLCFKERWLALALWWRWWWWFRCWELLSIAWCEPKGLPATGGAHPHSEQFAAASCWCGVAAAAVPCHSRPKRYDKTFSAYDQSTHPPGRQRTEHILHRLFCIVFSSLPAQLTSLLFFCCCCCCCLFWVQKLFLSGRLLVMS